MQLTRPTRGVPWGPIGPPLRTTTASCGPTSRSTTPIKTVSHAHAMLESNNPAENRTFCTFHKPPVLKHGWGFVCVGAHKVRLSFILCTYFFAICLPPQVPVSSPLLVLLLIFLPKQIAPARLHAVLFSAGLVASPVQF